MIFSRYKVSYALWIQKFYVTVRTPSSAEHSYDAMDDFAVRADLNGIFLIAFGP